MHLAILEHGSCVLIEKVVPAGSSSIATWIGKLLAFHCTAVGKAIAAHLPEDQFTTLIREQRLLRHIENTICSVRRLKQELLQVQQRGFALDNEEEEIGICCMGAPIFNGSTVVGAISILGSTNEIHSESLDSLGRSYAHRLPTSLPLPQAPGRIRLKRLRKQTRVEVSSVRR